MMIFASPTVMSMFIGFCFVGTGEFFRLWGVSIAGSETRTTGPVGGTFLITQGPFSRVRNPLYLGNMLMYLGVGIMSNALFPWLSVIALCYFVWQYSLIVSLEEEHLADKFGGEYERYAKLVPRFIPSFKKYPPGNNPQPGLDWKSGIISEKRTLQAVSLLTVIMVVLWYVRG